MAGISDSGVGAALPPTIDATSVEPVLSPGFAKLQAELLRLVRSRSIAILVGRKGAGKTTILRSVCTVLERSRVSCSMLQPGDALPARTQAVLVDDAHLLDNDVWEQITRRGGALLLAGPPLLLGRALASNRRVNILEVPDIVSSDVPDFIAEVVRQAGEPPSMFSAPAVSAACALAGRLPGRISAIVRLAIFVARLEGVASVKPHHVRQAATLADDDSELEEDNEEVVCTPVAQPVAGRFHLGVIAACVGLGVVFAPSVLQRDHRPVAALVLPPVPALPAPVEHTVLPPVIPDATPVTALPAPLPDPPRLYIAVLFAAGDAGAMSLGAAVTSALRTVGYAIADASPARIPSTGLELHYFFVNDAQAVSDLARAIGVAPASLRLVDADPRKVIRPGAVEILAGGATRRDR